MMVASYLEFRGWIRQDTRCNGMSVTFDLRQCAYLPCRDTPSIGGFGVRGEQPQKATPPRRADVRVCYRDALASSYSRRNSSSCQVILAWSRKLAW